MDDKEKKNSKSITLDDYRKRLLGEQLTKRVQPIPPKNENNHETKSKSISLDEYKKKLFEELLSKKTHPILSPKAIKTICIPPALEKKEEIRLEMTYAPHINSGKQPFNLEITQSSITFLNLMIIDKSFVSS